MERTPTREDLVDGVSLVTIQTPGLGNRSYLVVADGWAVAVDVQRDLDRVEQLLDTEGLRLAAVVETHVHNDYVTGGLGLARRHAARYVLPAGPELAFEADRGADGDVLDVGPLRLRVIGAPGHTDAHAVYSVHVDDTPAVAAFTGGSLLLGGTGRTDLLGAHRTEELARAQYWTVRRLARLLPSDARLLPTHGFGSFCLAGQAVATRGDSLADQLDVNPAFLLDEGAFVADLITRLGPIPAYFPLMGPRNVAGPEPADLTPPPTLPLSEVVGRASRGDWVVDVRSRRAHADAHVPRSVNVDSSGSLATWVGWTVPIQEPITVVAEDAEQLADAQRELARIGVDSLAGAHVGEVRVGDEEPALESWRRVHFGEMALALRTGGVGGILDVREDDEWRRGHVTGAVHVPTHRVAAALDRDGGIPEGPWVYCGMGFRAAIAASLIERAGGRPVVVDDAVSRARMSRVPWCEGTHCPDDRCSAADATVSAVDRRSNVRAGA